MVSELRVQPKAAEDMEGIACHIGEDSPGAADRWLARLGELFDTLSRFPRMAPCLIIDSRWRGMTYGSYLIVYREIPGGAEIIRVVHASRDIEAALAP